METPFETTLEAWYCHPTAALHTILDLRVLPKTLSGLISGLTMKSYCQDLCNAALHFSSIVLRTGGHFVCKFYQGIEDKELESNLKAIFNKVHRLKPESSRSVGLSTSLSIWPLKKPPANAFPGIKRDIFRWPRSESVIMSIAIHIRSTAT